MASREDDFKARMVADVANLMLILTGGVFTSGGVGLDGISRDSAPDAFDADGFLQPCALVKQAGNIPDGQVVDYAAQVASANQRVEIWLYQDRGYDAIDAAAARLYTLFQGHVLTGTFEIRLANVLDRQRDEGSLSGASTARLDWQVDSIIQ